MRRPAPQSLADKRPIQLLVTVREQFGAKYMVLGESCSTKWLVSIAELGAFGALRARSRCSTAVSDNLAMGPITQQRI